MKKKFHLYDQSFINPILNTFQKLGIDERNVAKGEDLLHFNYKKPNTYLPQSAVYEFFDKASLVLNKQNLIRTCYNDFNISELGEYGHLLKNCTDLLTTILEGIKNDYFFQTNSRMTIHIQGSRTYLRLSQTDVESIGKLRSLDIVFVMAIKFFRFFLGESWEPLHIWVPKRSIFDIESLNTFSSSKFWTIDKTCYVLCFNTIDLKKKNTEKEHFLQGIDNGFDTISERISRLLESTSPGRMPSISDYSQYFNYSTRSINRFLKEEGSTFSSLLHRSLFKKSIFLLEEGVLNVNEISQILGYSNESNFIRAFKSWAGVSPRAYK